MSLDDALNNAVYKAEKATSNSVVQKEQKKQEEQKKVAQLDDYIQKVKPKNT